MCNLVATTGATLFDFVARDYVYNDVALENFRQKLVPHGIRS